MKTGTRTQVPVPMAIQEPTPFVSQNRCSLDSFL